MGSWQVLVLLPCALLMFPCLGRPSTCCCLTTDQGDEPLQYTTALDNACTDARRIYLLLTAVELARLLSHAGGRQGLEAGPGGVPDAGHLRQRQEGHRAGAHPGGRSSSRHPALTELPLRLTVSCQGYCSRCVLAACCSSEHPGVTALKLLQLGAGCRRQDLSCSSNCL